MAEVPKANDLALVGPPAPAAPGILSPSEVEDRRTEADVDADSDAEGLPATPAVCEKEDKPEGEKLVVLLLLGPFVVREVLSPVLLREDNEDVGCCRDRSVLLVAEAV